MPYAGLVFDPSGNLYGTTWVGGSGTCNYGGEIGCGTVFQLKSSGSGWTENILYSFLDGSDGALPVGGLITDFSGSLYGTTTTADEKFQGKGTVFELSPSNGNWTFNLLYSFTGAAGPQGNLAMDHAGNLYGTPLQDGNGLGSVFKLTPSNGTWTETDLYDFSGSDGANPMGGVTLDSNGNLFGTTAYGGAYSCGVAYEITP